MRERYKTASAVMLFLLRERNGRQEILLQKRRNTGYADGMWDCGEAKPQICEPEKCAELRWFPLDALPETLLADRRAALKNFRAGVPYSEFGWPAG